MNPVSRNQSGQNSPLRYAFLALPYSMKNAAIPKEMMVDYITNHIYFKKDDGSIGSKTKELEDRLNGLLEDGTVGAAPIHEFTSSDKCIIFYHNQSTEAKTFLYKFQMILDTNEVFNFDMLLYTQNGNINVILNEFNDPKTRPSVRVEGNKVYVELDGVKYGKVFNSYLSTIFDQYITDIDNIVAKYDYMMIVHPGFLPEHETYEQLSAIIKTYKKSISTLVPRFNYTTRQAIVDMFDGKLVEDDIAFDYGYEDLITTKTLLRFYNNMVSKLNTDNVFKSFSVNVSNGLSGGGALTGNHINIALDVPKNGLIGGVKAGSTVTISADGTLDVHSSVFNASTLNGKTGAFYLDWNNFTNVPSLAPSIHNHTSLTAITSLAFASGASILSEGADKVKYVARGIDIQRDADTSISATILDGEMAYTSSNNILKYTFDKPISASVEGNATSASKLRTTVDINGVPFDGSKSITITAAPDEHRHDWSNLDNIPSTFPPESHVHADIYYTKNEIAEIIKAIQADSEWKQSVDTFDDIATTYPKPEIGWTVNVNDTNITYRWNGTIWVAISANSITAATNTKDGLMTKEHVVKLESVEPHPKGDGNLHVPATGTNNAGKVLKAGTGAGNIQWAKLLWSEIEVSSLPTVFPPSAHSHRELDDATASAVANTLVKRDQYGNIACKEVAADLNGNAKTATKLKAPVRINNIPFDGSSDITISAAPTAHIHTWTDISDRPVVATTLANGLMSTAMVTKLESLFNYTHPVGDGNLHVPATGTNKTGQVLLVGPGAGNIYWGNVPWASLSNVPSFAPAGHVHDDVYAKLSHKHTEYALTQHGHIWSEIENKPSTFPPDNHTHESITTNRQGGSEICAGNGQGADYETQSLHIKSYRSIGFRTMNGACNIIMDLANGNISAKGVISAPKLSGAWYNNDYAELFEIYEDQVPEPGHILMLDPNGYDELGNEIERYILATEGETAIAGVVSDEWAHLIGGAPVIEDGVEASSKYDELKYAPVGLAGRVHVFVTGDIKRGDKIVVSNIPGVGRAKTKEDDIDTVIGVALESNTETGTRRVRIKIK